MDMNEKLSEGLAVLATINPSSQAVGTAYTGWVPMANVRRILALIQVGTFGASATVDASVDQAQDAAGTGAKGIGGPGGVMGLIVGGSRPKAITLLAAGGDNVQALIDVDATELDVANGYGFVQLSITVGVAATQTAALILGGSARYEPASAFNSPSVVQVV